MAQYSGIIPQFSDPASYEGLPASMLSNQLVNVKQSDEDKRLGIRFFNDAWFEAGASQEADRPIFSVQTFVEVITDALTHTYVARLPKTTTRDGRKVWTDESLYWQRRFPEHWKRFEEIDSKKVGLPLSFLPNTSADVIATLEACNVSTIEQCALLEDAFIRRFPELEQTIIRARRWTEANDLHKEKDEEIAKLKAELDSLKTSEVKQELDDLGIAKLKTKK
jgi:hypothetical protein